LGEQVEIKTEMARSRSTVLADRHILQSAILNLALNARDAMPQGGAITISTGERRATAADGCIPQGQPVSIVTVSDTGVGIPPDILERVFEPFFTTKEVGKGTGLGLSMVHGFAEQSGGHVSIESRVGQGTSVTLVLPVSREVQAVAKPDDDEASVPTPKAKLRLLVVEDEPQVLQFVTGQLVHLGHEVTAVSTASDALALLSRGQCFDLLFTDVVLPKGTSGVELARKAAAMCPGLKVLLTSGYSEEVFEQHGRPPEGTPLLRKPYRRKGLLQALDQALG
jgi:CheY-like chemotaxis protein